MISSVLYRCAHGHELRIYRLAPVCGVDGCHSVMIEIKEAEIKEVESQGQTIHPDQWREMLPGQNQGEARG